MKIETLLPLGALDPGMRAAFYASTPAYAAAFETDGYAEVARNLQGYARAQRWEEMLGLVDDAMLRDLLAALRQDFQDPLPRRGRGQGEGAAGGTAPAPAPTTPICDGGGPPSPAVRARG